MRKFRTLAGILFGALALTALASATAFASLPEFNPAKGTFAGTSGAGTLKGAITLKCSTDKLTGEITSGKTMTVDLDCEGTEALGVKVHSAGDEAGVILIKLDGELCYINEARREVGVYFTILPTSGVTIEGVGLKSVTKGTIIGVIEPTNKKQTTGTITFKKPNLKECGGKKAETLANLNGGTFSALEIETTENLVYAVATEVKA